MGRRIAKHVYDDSWTLEKSTYYALDAQGNAMSVYEYAVDNVNSTVTYTQEEKYIYGSARLGVLNESVYLFGSVHLDEDMSEQTHTTGQRNYELTNHLGNVLSVISDKIKPHDDDSDGTIDWYVADIRQSTDYSPFGVILHGRNMKLVDPVTGNPVGKMRFGFQNQEMDDEIKGEGNSYTTEYRQYDPRLGRWLTLDPLSRNFPWMSPYVGMDNNPIRLTDSKGLSTKDFVKKANGTIYWDKKANSQATTKEGETYLGKTLTFEFKSYIDSKLWDGPMGKIPAGVKLTSTITLKAQENSEGEITNVSASFAVKPGATPVGSPRTFYPGAGGSNNQRKAEQTKTTDGTVQQFKLTFEQHASVSPAEEFGMNQMGYKIVDVAQKLNLVFNKGYLWIGSYTDIFPSATLTVNGHKVMQYNQPSFVETHTAPTTWDYLPPYYRKDFSYYPSKLFYRK